jgi:hypothetical protein
MPLHWLTLVVSVSVWNEQDGDVVGRSSPAWWAFSLYDQDVFVNVVGGVRVGLSPAADLALLAAVVSACVTRGWHMVRLFLVRWGSLERSGRYNWVRSD